MRVSAQVVVLDRSLQQVRSWQAHAGGVKHLVLVEVRSFWECHLVYCACIAAPLASWSPSRLPCSVSQDLSCIVGGPAVHPAHSGPGDAQTAGLGCAQGLGHRQPPGSEQHLSSQLLHSQAVCPEAGRGRRGVCGCTRREAACSSCGALPVLWPDPYSAWLLPRCGSDLLSCWPVASCL